MPSLYHTWIHSNTIHSYYSPIICLYSRAYSSHNPLHKMLYVHSFAQHVSLRHQSPSRSVDQCPRLCISLYEVVYSESVCAIIVTFHPGLIPSILKSPASFNDTLKIFCTPISNFVTLDQTYRNRMIRPSEITNRRGPYG